MCAIVDANVVSEVFGTNPTEAGMQFFLWIERNVNGRLAVGGKLLEELSSSSPGFREWALQAQRSGNMRLVDQAQVKSREDDLRKESNYKSNDPHIIALAQVSGARLLYSNDKKLQEDFKDPKLVNDGKVYSTRRDKHFSDSHKHLLAQRDLCRVKL